MRMSTPVQLYAWEDDAESPVWQNRMHKFDSASPPMLLGDLLDA